MVNLKVGFAGKTLKNPLVMASGTFGFGKEYGELFDIERLGGIATKGITLEKRPGNKGIRIWETSSGILNSVGLENPGVEEFINCELPFLKSLDVVTIVNIGGKALQDYIDAISLVSKEEVDIIELNISCPNVKEGGMAFGLTVDSTRRIVKAVRNATSVPLMVKLSPNAEDIVKIARVCQEEGADGISLVNTFKAMAIDINKRKSVFDNIYAGLSGPAIKPIALRMVHEVCKYVEIPVMGVGGITTWRDAIEFIMAGATCVQIGTANFIKPTIPLDILEGLETFMEKEGIGSFEEIRGII
jgi:dihydroorotate dehydrogenase (NAD+) catalytic subunit